jgi:amino acid transporter
MIQRIQSVYYAIAAICIIIASFGSSIYVFTGKSATFILTGFGVAGYDAKFTLVSLNSYPYYLVGIALVLLLTITFLSYKNVARQLKLGRLVLFLYFILLILLLLGSFLGSYLTAEEELTRGLGLGFFMFIIGFPFVFLGNIGVKRDKTLLDSLDRLR